MATKKKNDVGAAIRAANKALGATIAAGDAKGAAACYTKSARLLPPNAPQHKGHAAIARFWQGAIDMGVKKATLRTIEIDAHGTTAIETGAYTLNGARGKKLDNGKYVVVWKRERGDWKLHWDMFNSNNPA